MGQEQSDMNVEGVAQVHGEDPEEVDVMTLSGYRVMKVFRGSPAARSGLASFEDFIVAVNGSILDGDGALASVLADSEDVELLLAVWNCVDSAERTVTLTPAKWNGPGLLGAAVRYEPIKAAVDHVWRVLDVMPHSPADDAGLVPRSDYIVGTTVEVFRSENALSNLIKDAAKNNVAASVMVYSTATGRARNVEIMPNSKWGGDGLLGCELATGLLHRLSREGPKP